MHMRISVTAGRPSPLGATPDEGGVNFAVFSAHATRMTLCLFDEAGRETRIDLPEREGHIWHGHVAGIRTGQLYGFRAHGPFAPEEGHRFNPNKLLIDPYARRLTGHPIWHDALYGHMPGTPEADLAFDPRDSAPYMPRSVVTQPHFPHDPRHPRTELRETIIYEAHVKGLTQRHPDIARPGTFTAAASDPILDHLTRLGITAIEFLPIQAFLNDRFLVEKGLTNYWGYQTIGFFAPDPRYLTGTDIARGPAHGRPLPWRGDRGDHGRGLQPHGRGRGRRTRRSASGGWTIKATIGSKATGVITSTTPAPETRCVAITRWCCGWSWTACATGSRVMGVDGFRFDLGATLGRTAHGFDRDAPLFQAMRQDPVLAGVKLIAEPWDIGPGGYQLGGFPRRSCHGTTSIATACAGSGAAMRAWPPISPPGSLARPNSSTIPAGRATSSVNFVTAHDGFTLEDVVSYSPTHNVANGEDGPRRPWRELL